ncbi:MAG TPA: YidC/Oxa1 family insertase periplasmic-domain containing protein [Phycisphaerae bacterium]|nr:YidC/Oxa1 family insertase periplasmic-domain containing protein [Phycisphaerae bacterium]
MDTRRLLTTLLIAVALYVLLVPLLRSWSGHNGGNEAAAPSTLPYTLATQAASQPASAPATALAANAATQPASMPASAPAGPSTTVTLGDATSASKDKVELTIDSITAGVDRVRLNINDYAETVAHKEPLVFMEAVPGAPRPFATMSVTIAVGKGAPAFYDLFARQTSWALEASSHTAATFKITLTDDHGKPLIDLEKTYQIDPATYDLSVQHRVRNLTDQPITVAINQLGPTDLPRDNQRFDDRSYDAATLDTAKKIVVAPVDVQMHASLAKFPGGSHAIGAFSGSGPVLWTAAANRFFVAITRPLPTPGAGAPFDFTLEDGRHVQLTNHVASADLDAFTLPVPAGAAVGTAPEQMAITRLNGAALTINPGASADMPLTVYLGPKKREILSGDRDAAPGSDPYLYNVYKYFGNIRFNQSSLCGQCTFEWLAYLILRLLDFLHGTIAFHNYGVAIILLVLVVRAILHPLTRASQINMAVMGKKMKEIQPLLEASKKKYAKDSKKASEEQLRIYRENNVNPAGPLLGCLPMLLQTPIWIALYAGLAVDIDLRHAPFIPGWINDLSNPDTIYPHPIPPIGHPLFHLPLLGDIYGLNLLPILLVAVYYFNMKAMTASQPAVADPNQAQVQAMSKYMVFLFPIFLYNAPSGLNLYIFASTIGGLIDTWFIRRTLKARGILPQSAAGVASPNPLM